MGLVWIVVVLLVIICALFGRRLYGKTLEQIFEETEREHIRVHSVLAQHPRGGTWAEYKRWLDAAGSNETTVL